MENTILDSVNAELAKRNEPAKPIEQEKVIEENQPIKQEEKPEAKQEEPISKDKPEEKKDDKEDYKTVEIDKKFVTYERFKDVNEKYKTLKAEFAEFQKNKKDIDLDDDAKEEHARLKKMGFATKDEQEMQKFQIKEEQIKQEEQEILNKEFKKLERDFDGSDGLPKFNKDSVMERGIQNQVFDPKSAYIVMNLPTIINHFVNKAIGEVKKQPTFGKNNDIVKPDITPKDKLDLKGSKLQEFLTEKIKGMMG